MTGLAPDTAMRLAKDNPELRDDVGQLLSGIDDMCDAFRHLPLKDFPFFEKSASYFYDWVAHPDDDDYWAQLNIENRHDTIPIPACNVGGWYDIFLGGTIRNYLGMRERGASAEARNGQKLVIGPWHHTLPLNNIVGEANFGLASTPLAADMDGLHIRWFELLAQRKTKQPVRRATSSDFCDG